MTYLFISTDLNVNSSGGMITSKELETMECLAKENKENIIHFSFQDIHPLAYGLPDCPYLIDYLTLHKLYQINDIKLAHMYGGSYLYSIKYLKSKGAKVTYSRMAHDRKISIEEHENIFGPNSYPFPHIKDDKLWPIYMGGIKEVDIVITPGEAPKRTLINEGVKKENIRIISHGTNIPLSDNIEPIPTEFRCGILGNLGPDKGLIYLLQAWSYLNYDDATLIIAGRGSEHLEPFIRRYANGGIYRLLGYVQDIADFYKNISLYVQPSATEAFGMETVEAMSYGRPVICSDGAGSADAITDGIDGFIVPKRDPDAIADKIDWFYNNQNQLIIMGKNAKEKSKQYDWNIIKNTYINLWKSLLIKTI